VRAICGIDWASEWHDVRIADADSGEKIAQRRFAHDEAGISALVDELVACRVERVALERPDGLLVGRLLAAGLAVLAIHPNQVKAARDRFRAAAGKTDRFDSFVLCELARTDAHRFAALAPSGDETMALRALVRTREDLVGARGLGPKRLEGFLARHAYSGRRSVEGLLERLRSAPQAVIGELEADARRAAVLGLVAALEPIVSQISELTSQIRGAIRAHPDGPIFLPVFRDPNSVVCAAGLLCEIGDNRARYPHRDALAADGGQAPVAIESGKRRSAAFRWACDKRLRNHLAVLADSSRHHHPWANDIYQRARDRGCDHPHACRILGRAWTRILWRCWQDRVPYDPTKHRAATRHIQQGG